MTDLPVPRAPRGRRFAKGDEIVIRLESARAAAPGVESGAAAKNCGKKMARSVPFPGAACRLRYSRSIVLRVRDCTKMTRRIAIVEDEPAIRANYADALRKHGYEVSAYATRVDALAAFRTRLPDLALIDIGLGDEVDGGFALCRELRAMSPTAADPFPHRARLGFRRCRRPAPGRRRLPHQGREPAAPAARASPRSFAAATCCASRPRPRTCIARARSRSTRSASPRSGTTSASSSRSPSSGWCTRWRSFPAT